MNISLLQNNPNYLQLTEPQAETYQLLLSLKASNQPTSVEALTAKLNCIKPALLKRLENLQNKGWIAIEEQ